MDERLRGQVLRSPYLRTLIVVVLFGVLLAYVLFFEAKREPPLSEDATPTPSPIVDLDVADLEAVGITQRDQVLRIERQGEGWQIVTSSKGSGGKGPQLPAPADAFSLQWALQDLAQLEASLVVLDQVPNPSAYGLDDGALAVTLEAETGESALIRVGRKTPDGTAFYVQQEGDPRLYLVPQFKLAPLFDWLDEPPYPPTPGTTP